MNLQSRKRAHNPNKDPHQASGFDPAIWMGAGHGGAIVHVVTCPMAGGVPSVQGGLHPEQ